MRWKDTQSEFYPRHSDANASLMPDRLIGLFGEEILPERRGRPDAAEGEDKDYRVARLVKMLQPCDWLPWVTRSRPCSHARAAGV
jgi:hypothetical protein